MCAPCVPGLPDAGKAGGGDQTTRWDRELPRVQGGGKSKGVGDTGVEARGGRPGASKEGRQAAAGGSARRPRRAANPPGRPPPEPWRSRPGARHVAPGGGGGDSSRRTARPAGSTQPPVSSPPSAGGLLDAARNPEKGRAGGAKPL